MKPIARTRRLFAVVATTILLAGCQIVPKVPTSTDPVDPGPSTGQTTGSLPSGDNTRHRIALLVPMSGTNGAVGSSIANATQMALLDTNAANLRITTYDTATGARSAAAKAIADGNKLILGPLTSSNIPLVLAEARPADVPIVSFSNDAGAAGPDVFVMGQIPSQSITRTVNYASDKGSSRYAAIIPEGEYGQRVEAAFAAAVANTGGALVASEKYNRGNTSIVSAAQRLSQRGGFDSILIADGAQRVILASREIHAGKRILGTELLSGESSVANVAALRGMIFSSISDSRFKRFSDSYRERFGRSPYRIATLGYDSVLLTLRIANDWNVGQHFPRERLRDSGGFLGLDGPFRFQRSGVAERAMEVREVRESGVIIVSPAPASFSG